MLAIDKYAQVPRDTQVAARLLDDRDLVKRAQKALGERHARDDRIDYVPAGGEQVEALAKKVEDMKTQMEGDGWHCAVCQRTSLPESTPRAPRDCAPSDGSKPIPSSKSGHVCRDGGETCGVP